MTKDGWLIKMREGKMIAEFKSKTSKREKSMVWELKPFHAFF